MLEPLVIHVIAYQQDGHWLAQGLEFDVGAQAKSLPELHRRIAVSVAAEIAVSVQRGEEPLAGIDRAPKKFWQMFEAAKLTIEAEPEPMRVSPAALVPRVVPKMRVGEMAA